MGDLMRSRNQLKMLSYQQVKKRSIPEVLQAMRRHGRAHRSWLRELAPLH